MASLDFPKDASLAVVDGEGRNIVWRGAFPMAWSAPTERLALNEGNTVTSGTVTLGGTPYLTLERRFPALNWSIRTAVPVSTITEPASRHALELVRIALFLFGVISVLGIAHVTRILNPLGRISATAKRLESYRFDDPFRVDGVRLKRKRWEHSDFHAVKRAVLGLSDYQATHSDSTMPKIPEEVCVSGVTA